MITYGHEKFIEQAINGVLMQECDFEVELIIANDCSPDKTDDVIQNLLKNHSRASWIKYIKHKKNLGMTPNFIFALKECDSKYIALCEGDDYWTDPLKLQKQVDFLEKNDQASGCFHNASLVDYKSQILKEIYNPHVSKFEFYDQKQCLTVLGSSYATCSLVFRTQVLKNVPKKIMIQLCDELLDIVITENGVLYFLNFNSACYRFHSGGVWSGGSDVKSKINLYLRTEVLYSVPAYKRRYSSYLKTRFFLLAQDFLFSNSIKRKMRIFYFVKTLQFLDYTRKKSYDFIFNFFMNVTGLQKTKK